MYDTKDSLKNGTALSIDRCIFGLYITKMDTTRVMNVVLQGNVMSGFVETIPDQTGLQVNGETRLRIEENVIVSRRYSTVYSGRCLKLHLRFCTVRSKERK